MRMSLNRKKIEDKVKKWTLENLTSLIILTLVVVTCMLIISYYSIVGINYFVLFGMIALGFIFYGGYIKFIIKLSKGKRRFFLLLVIAFLIAYIKIEIFVNLTYFREYMSKLYTMFYYSQDIKFTSILSWIIIIPFFTFFALIMDYYGKGFYYLIIEFLIIVNAAYYDEDDKVCFFIAAVMFVFYMSIVIYKSKYREAEKDKLLVTLDRNRLFAYYGALGVLVITAAFIFISISGTNSISQIRRMMEDKVIKNLDFNSMFSVADVGFGGKDKLGGPIKLKDDIVFRVESDKPYYLKGATKDYYDGTKWVKSTYDYQIEKGPNKQILSSEALRTLLGKKADDPFVKPKTISIYNENYKSSSLFVPYNTVYVSANKYTVAMDSDNTYLVKENKKDVNFYNISFYESTTGIDNFDNFPNENLKFKYDPFSKIASVADDYNKNVTSKYKLDLQIPFTLTNRTRELANEITKKSPTAEGKVRLIMHYLQNNFRYDTNVSNVPQGKEFIDNFLFEEKKGYCTYFATTAAILCRLQGVPARYVEGYKMSYEIDSNGMYVVRARDAHAWCEVLVSPEQNLWAVLDCTPSAREDTIRTSQAIGANSRILNWKNENGKIKLNNETINVQNTTIKTVVKGIIGLAKAVLCLTLLCVIALFFYKIIEVLRSIYYFNKRKKVLLKSNSISLLYYFIKERLICIGINELRCDSDEEYVERITDENLHSIIGEIVNIYREEFYGSNHIKVEYNKEEYLKKIEHYIKDRQSFLKYYKNKYKINLRLHGLRRKFN